MHLYRPTQNRDLLFVHKVIMKFIEYIILLAIKFIKYFYNNNNHSFILAEASWMQGGSRPQMPQGIGGVTGVPGQTHHSQTLTGMLITI